MTTSITTLFRCMLLACTIILVGMTASIDFANAQSPFTVPAELQGYAWSSNIGWISLNCKNTNTCGTVDYGVIVAPTGQMTGYAWSSNIGWVKFGGLGTPPTATGNAGGQARLVQSGSNYQVEGWARACAGAANSGSCSGSGAHATAGGWDGWISFRGTSPNYGVTFVSGQVGTNNSQRYAWGSDVVGWVDFRPGNVPVIIDPVGTIVSFTATPDEVTLGNTVSLAWDIIGFDSCTASNNRGTTDWTGSVPSADGVNTRTVTPPNGDIIYTLSCSDGGVVTTDTVTVTARPDIIVNAFSVSTLPTPNPDGTYDNVQFLASVAGIPSGSSVNYRLSVAGMPDLTGTVTQSGASTNFAPPLRMSGIMFGDRDITLEIDLPRPGAIVENLTNTAGVNEDVIGNRFVLTDFRFDAPAPTMTLSSNSDFVRVGEQAVVSWTVQAPYVSNCSVVGNGINQSFSTSGNFATVYSSSATTPALDNTAAYTLTCDEPLAGTTYSPGELVVEVVPDFEEI